MTFCNRLDYMIINGKPRNVTVTVHGDGPIPWMAWKNPSENIRHADPDAMSKRNTANINILITQLVWGMFTHYPQAAATLR